MEVYAIVEYTGRFNDYVRHILEDEIFDSLEKAKCQCKFLNQQAREQETMWNYDICTLRIK